MGEIIESFSQSMNQLASGVSIVTTEVDGRPWGRTVNTCSAVSMSPPLLLISLPREAGSTNAIMEQKQFGVSILSQNQVDIARFGSSLEEPKYFEQYVSKDPLRGTYVVNNSMDHIHCELYDTVDAGDQIIFIGLVKDVVHGDSNLPLLYSQREFGTFSYY